MALSTGMATFTLTFGIAGVLGEDEDLGMRVTATAATNAIWQATGRPFLLKPQVQTADIGQAGQITLISPDQDGFVNAYGQQVRNWTYLLHIEYFDESGVIASVDKNFAYLTSMGSTLDLDLTVPVSTSAGVVVDIPTGGAGGGYDGGTVYDPGGTTPPAGDASATTDGAGVTTFTGTGVTDNGDGTGAVNSSTVTDNGDGTYTLVA